MSIALNLTLVSVFIHQGQKTILSCSATNTVPGWSDPMGRLINYPDESYLVTNYPYQNRFSVSQSGYLVINNTQWTDAGKYSCFYPGHGHQTVTLVVRRKFNFCVYLKTITKTFLDEYSCQY